MIEVAIFIGEIMIGFKKAYYSKIIALFVAVTFFLNSTGYGINLSEKNHQ